MIQWPSLLGGKHKLVGWLNKIVKCCKASEIKQVVGEGYLKENSDGKILVITAKSRASDENPFIIYQGSTRLKMKVTTGDIITTGAAFEPSNPDTELTITDAEAKNYIYLEFASASSASFVASSTVPAWDVNKIPIGWVDTSDSTTSVIHQLQREYIYNPCL